LLKAHLEYYGELYLILLSWALFGAFLPKLLVVVYSVITFILILRTQDFSKVFLALVCMLIFSDSRQAMFAFAATAKIGVMLSLFTYLLFNWKVLKDKTNRLFVFFLPFLIFSVLSTLWSNDAFNTFQKIFSYGLVYFTVPILYKNALIQRSQFSMDLLMFFLFIVLSGITIYLINPSFVTLLGRYRGLLGNPNGLGILSTLVFLLFYLEVKSNKIGLLESNFNKFFLLVFFISLFLTGSRNALISILIFVVFNYIKFFSQWVVLIVFVLLLVSYDYLLSLVPNIVMTFGLQEYFRLDTLEEGSGRFIAWNFAWEQIQQKFYFGGGYGFTEYVFKKNYTYLSQLGHQGNAHNSYLTLWLDTGIIGLGLFLLGLMRVIFASVKNSAYTLPVFYAVLFSANFESWLTASLNPFTSIFILVLTVLLSQDHSNINAIENPNTL
jgi:O-antigen ligase